MSLPSKRGGDKRHLWQSGIIEICVIGDVIMASTGHTVQEEGDSKSDCGFQKSLLREKYFDSGLKGWVSVD